MENQQVTAAMMDDLKYDPVEDVESDICDKMENLRASNPKCFTFDKYEVPQLKWDDVCEFIKSNLQKLAELERDNNKIPSWIAKRHLEKGLEFATSICEQPKIFSTIQDLSPLLDARHHTSLLEVVYNFLLLMKIGCKQMIVCMSRRRTVLWEYIWRGLKFEKKFCELNEDFKTIQAFEPKVFPYTSMFVFESGDQESAAHHLAISIEDPVIPWRVRSVYVQESCYDNFCKRLEPKLLTYPAEMLDDSYFQEKYKEALEKIRKYKAKLLKDSDGQSVPLICHEFNRDYFDTDIELSPVVILKQFRTPKEALTLAKTEKGGLASIWSEKMSLAYEFSEHLKANTIWINCLGVLEPSIPFTLREDSNCIGSFYGFLDFFLHRFHVSFEANETTFTCLEKNLSNNFLVSKPYHYQYSAQLDSEKLSTRNSKVIEISSGGNDIRNIIGLKDPCWNAAFNVLRKCKIKTIVFSFGTIFAN